MRLLVITQIIDNADPGLGFFHQWLEVFAEESESVIALCLKEGQHEFPPNVRVVSLGKENGASRLKYLWRFYTTIWKYRHEYDAVFVHMNPEYVVLGGIPWRLMGKKISLWYAHRTVNMKLRIAAVFAHQIFTGSKESFRIITPKVLVTGQGVDTTRFAPIDLEPHDALTLLVVGRVAPIKNLEFALDIIDALRASMKVTLRIVGAPGKEADKAYEEKIKADIVARGLSEYVVMTGGKDQEGVRTELHAADIFLHTSNTNSADKTAVEAMAVGCYIVSSSPVYARDLPESSVQPQVVGAYVDEIKRYAALPHTEQQRLSTLLREAAVREHSLGRLIRLIVHTLQSL